MRYKLPGKQQVILDAIKQEIISGKSMKEAIKYVMLSKQFNHMTVKKVAQILEDRPEILN